MPLRHALSALALAVALGGPLPAAAQPAPQAAAALPATVREASQPNVLIWMMDDVGFAQLSCFGGLVPTPNIDRVARMGLRYSNYHTPPICSAARATLLTGRNSHSVHIGGHSAIARAYPGYDGKVPAGAGSIAENFRQAGYATFALGKWDHVPPAESTPAGPTRYWPLGQGFDRFYGFMSAETHNFEPLLWQDNRPVNRPPGQDYHVSADLADQAIAMIDARGSAEPARPFLMYFATGAAHAPHHAPADWIARMKGRFDGGWDKARADILKRQKAMGLVPKSAGLAPRPPQVAAWDSLSPEARQVHARQMEVFAAALAHADAQFGRILDQLEKRGELDNTMVVIVSDNGASGEGGPAGSYHELLFAHGGLPQKAEENLPFLDKWGGPETYPHYALGWAVAGNTPFRNYKQTTYEGGTRVPLVVAWPKGIAARGEVRDQFIHTSDITPTLLAAAGVKPAELVNNTPQVPFEGQDFGYSFAVSAKAPPRSQYFEMFGHRGLWKDNWKAVAYSKLESWDMYLPGRIDRPWELYDLSRDPQESVNLAARMPEKLAELDHEFEAQAKRYNVYPLADQAMIGKELAPKMAEDLKRRGGTWRFAAPVSRIWGPDAPPIQRGAFTMRATVTPAGPAATGPIWVQGGINGGMGFYLDQGRPAFASRTMAGTLTVLAAAEPLPPGTSQVELSLAPADPANPRGDRLLTVRANGRVLLSHRGPLRMESGETFDIASDDGSALVSAYPAGARFPGDVRDMTFTFP